MSERAQLVDENLHVGRRGTRPSHAKRELLRKLLANGLDIVGRLERVA
ncbi:MAG TPA: hypothetical protein VJV78_41155 [Polyangiales bacterium]|nr:hypothetical protein [Polyangiales bacterium]